MPKKKTYQEVQSLFESRGYVLLSTEYKNAHAKLDCTCPKGHALSISYTSFQQGAGCAKCASEESADKRRLPYDTVRALFEAEGYMLLSREYRGAHHKLECVCPNGHYISISYANFQQGKRCRKCSILNRSKSRALTYDQVSAYFANYGYTLLSEEYTNSSTKLRYRCPKGHVGSMSYANFSFGKRCPVCACTISRPEIELREYVESLAKRVLGNVRDVIPPNELDIFIPDNKLAIEYCGLRWHSEVFGGKHKSYHRTKMDMCVSKGIRLITVFEDEYLAFPDVVKSRIANALGVLPSIYARKCTLHKINNSEALSFLSKYHLQGEGYASAAFGLVYEGELVQVLTVGGLSRAHASVVGGKRHKVLELKRFASKPFISVVGGASRLFKQAVNYAREHGYEYIKSYSDNRYANPFSSIYEQLGFVLVGETKYTPHYVIGKDRIRNQSLRKTPEERLTGKTEWQLRQEQGYDRIWDCGHRTYLYEVK